MPNSRRRKFSVRNGIASREPTQQIQNFMQTSPPDADSEIKLKVNNLIAMKNSKSRNKIHPNSSKNPNNIGMITECDSSTSMVTVKQYSHATVDKDITASASKIDLFTGMYASEGFAEPWREAYRDIMSSLERNETQPNTRHDARDRTPLKKEKHRQHRVKVRSPKRRMGIGNVDTQNMSDFNNQSVSIGTEAIVWECEAETSDIVPNVVETIEDDERQSDHSSDDMCRICHGNDSLSPELGQLISACSCRGTVGRVHVKCLERWLTESGKTRCELCGTRYATRRVHRYGVLRALLMWILSQNAKQLMVDSLGIMLMSPLAVLAAWLSGRTLAGLMMHDAHATPWPLASTFVLACMTLVCYYCWIVSAATRHALGWWIWYRSQYEVRLELLDAEES